jgi:uncharacterized protein (TIGR02271 family)
MATMQKDEILQCRGQELLDRHGEKLGEIEEIYLDTGSDAPEWALVKTGLFGSKSTFVPLHDASREGDSIRVPYEKAQVKDAPRIDPDGALSAREEAELYRHYGMHYGAAPSDSGRLGDTDRTTDAGTTTGGADEAMTRSEEELRVDTSERESGRVRLRKWVDTEDVTKTVPVSREEARVEREPITDENRDAAMSGPEISEGEHEVVLHEEEVVADKEVVPKERVRLEKDEVTDEREVSETVRKERLEVDDSERDR